MNQHRPAIIKPHLDKYNIDVELTATTRVGVHRYTYPSNQQANIIIDLQHRDQVLDSWIEVVNDHEIRGFRRSKSWANDQSVYFYAKFSKPFKTYGIASNDQLQQGKSKVQGKNIKMYIQFDNPGEVISKVGISSVSADGALKNLDAEVPDFDFKKVAKGCQNRLEQRTDIKYKLKAARRQLHSRYRKYKPNTGYNTNGYHTAPTAKESSLLLITPK